MSEASNDPQQDPLATPAKVLYKSRETAQQAIKIHAIDCDYALTQFKEAKKYSFYNTKGRLSLRKEQSQKRRRYPAKDCDKNDKMST